MASEVLQILNLSPIPELSEIELSTVLEQLSGLSDQNGEVTDRNVEDILREAEELIDTSISLKSESVDSRNSFKYKDNSRRKDEESNELDKSLDLKSNECEKQLTKTEDATNSKESTNDILNLSLTSDSNSLENGKSECTVSNKNEIDSSDATPVQTPRSLTNHIQSTLVSLRECSQKFESRKNSSPCKTEEHYERDLPHNADEVSCSTGEQQSESLKSETERIKFSLGSESGKTCLERVAKQLVTETRKSSLKENSEKNKSIKQGSRGLSLHESMKTLDCFERLYRGKPARGDIKRQKTFERTSNDKKTISMKVSKTMNPSKYESIHKLRKSKEIDSFLGGKKFKPYVYEEFDEKYNHPRDNKHYPENATDEEISFEKCLKLLNEESESQSNLIEMPSVNYAEFAEKMLKECTASVSALQGEVKDIKSQMKRNETNKKDSLPNSKSNLIHRFCSQEDIVQILKEENSKLFKEIEEIKEQLKTSAESSRSSRGPEKVEVVEKLRSEVENLRQSLITAYSENNGISRLEEQFSLLKMKYDLQIGKLESENKKLRDVLSAGGGERESFTEISSDRRSRDAEAQTEDFRTVGESDWRTRRMVRSLSLENCRRGTKAFSRSCENVDAATSPIRQEDRELCSVSVQCKGEDGEMDQLIGNRRGQQLKQLENKENIRREMGKSRGLNPSKQKKLSEHENELMVTVRGLHSEITVKDRDNKKLRNELEAARNQIRRLAAGIVKHKSEVSKRICQVGTQTIGLNPKIREEYDPAAFQVSREVEAENEELKSRVIELERVVEVLKEKRIRDLQVLQKLHEEEIDKLASRLNTQTALTNHLHSLLTNR